MESALYSLGIVLVAALAIGLISKWKWGRAVEVAHVAEALAVIGALSLAALEYHLHASDEEKKEREAATIAIFKSFDPKSIDEALGNVYRKYNPDHRKDDKEDQFDDETGSLQSYFWSLDACVVNKLCSAVVVRGIYCDDYRIYYKEYLAIHGAEKTKQEFENLTSLAPCLSD